MPGVFNLRMNEFTRRVVGVDIYVISYPVHESPGFYQF